jgi:thiamine-monophosphate kinase
MELSEDELIAAVGKVLSGASPSVVVGIGDDAAVVTSGSGETVLAADMAVEGVHFDRALASARDIGAKALTVNLSDLAAMAASPRHALVSLALAPDVRAAWVIELFSGLRDVAHEHAMSIVGGDLSRGDRVVVSIAVTGEVAPGRAVTRSGARVDEQVVVTGSLGAAAGGLVLMRSGLAPQHAASWWARELERAYLRPVARVGEAQTLAAAGATAMIDVSDGLALDLFRLCRASGVGARLELGSIPVAEALLEAEGVLDIDPVALALDGGDAYELALTLPPTCVEPARAALSQRFGVSLTQIGVIIEEGFTAVDEAGGERPLEPRGWDHFRDT